MNRANGHRDEMLKSTQQDAANEVAKAKQKAQEASKGGSSSGRSVGEGETPTKGKEIPRE